MSKRLFTPEEISILEKNPYVKRASEKTITYTDEFRYFFVEEYLKGSKSKVIFEKPDSIST